MAPILDPRPTINDHEQDFLDRDNTLSKDIVLNSIIKKVSSINHECCEPGDEDPFFVVNLNEIRQSLKLWKARLPNIVPFYAVKCNNDPEVIKLLISEGVNFDCASKNELQYILNFGVDTDRIIYANPCKTSSYIRYAAQQKIPLTTVDNIDELYKIKQYYPDMGILIRIITDDESAQCRLSTKFGCDITTAMDILKISHELQLNVKGVAFHVGSGAKDNDSMHTAIKDCRFIFDEADKLGINLNVVDIGGGFERDTFNDSSSMVNYSLSKFFPPQYVASRNITFMAEPGRFMVSNAFTLVTNIIAKRSLPETSMLYINDGVYGNLNCILFDHQSPIPNLLPNPSTSGDDTYRHQDNHYSIWGPTCDGLDRVGETMLPEANIGDWLYFRNVGAYTSVASTSFNGFVSNEFVYVE